MLCNTSEKILNLNCNILSENIKSKRIVLMYTPHLQNCGTYMVQYRPLVSQTVTVIVALCLAF